MADSERAECRLLILRFKRQISGEVLCHWNENSWAMVGKGFAIRLEVGALHKMGREGKYFYIFSK